MMGKKRLSLPLSEILWVSVQVGTLGMSLFLLIVEISGWKTGQQRMSTSDGEAHCVARFQVVSAVCLMHWLCRIESIESCAKLSKPLARA